MTILHVLLCCVVYVVNLAIYETVICFAYGGVCIALDKRFPNSPRVKYLLDTYILFTIFAAVALSCLSFWGIQLIPYPSL